MRKDPLKWLFNTTTSGVIWHKRNIYFIDVHILWWTGQRNTCTCTLTTGDRLSFIHQWINEWMNEWEIKKKDGTEGLLLLLDDIWVLFILFFTTFLVRTRGLSRYLTYLDFSFFDRHNPALTLIIYISTYLHIKLNDW